jgi:RHS repeat-associated protein
VGDILYHHDDPLGSVETLSNSTGDIVERLSYGAFGQLRATNWRTGIWTSSSTLRPVGFTGHEDDDAAQSVNMVGRVYHPLFGRFLTPDPVISDPTFSQSLNRYSYVWNRPLTLADRRGLSPQEPETIGPHPGNSEETMFTAEAPGSTTAQPDGPSSDWTRGVGVEGPYLPQESSVPYSMNVTPTQTSNTSASLSGPATYLSDALDALHAAFQLQIAVTVSAGLIHPYLGMALAFGAIGNDEDQADISGVLLLGAAKGGPEFRTSYEPKLLLPVAETTQTSALKSALSPYGNSPLTNAGRALTKHPEVAGLTKDTIRSVLRTSAEINNSAEAAVRGMVEGGAGRIISHPKFGQVFEFQNPSGFGARFYADSMEFIGFINPGR